MNTFFLSFFTIMTTTKTIVIQPSTGTKKKPSTSSKKKQTRKTEPKTEPKAYPEDTAERIERLLQDYKELSMRHVQTKIQVMDSIRYAVDNELRYGGVVVHKEPEYLVLKNFAKQFTWRLDLTQPNLRVFWKKRVS